MRITNKKNLPEGIVQAVTQDYYTKGKAKYSITELSKPPQMRRLEKLHKEGLVVDVADEIWKLFGSAVHNILERASGKSLLSNTERQIAEISVLQTDYEDGEITPEEYTKKVNAILTTDYMQEDIFEPEVIQEKRLYLRVGDILISGAPDRFTIASKHLEDYKITSSYKVTKGDKTDWTAQLNCYALLLMQEGYAVDSLQITAIIRDWSRSNKLRYDDYPDCPVEVIPIPKWKPLETLRWIIDRVEKLELSETLSEKELYEQMPCTLKDKWQGEPTYAVMKKDGKRATAVKNTKVEADAISFSKGADYYVEKRNGKALRCEEYCLVKDFCYQYKVENTNGVSYDEMKTEALKELEELVPEKAEHPIPDKSPNGAVHTSDKLKELRAKLAAKASKHNSDTADKDASAITQTPMEEKLPTLPTKPEVIKPKEEESKSIDDIGNLDDFTLDDFLDIGGI